MSQRASELNHSEKVGGMAFPAAADTAVVLQPGKTAARLSNAGGSGAVAVHSEFAFARGDWHNQFDAVLLAQPFIQPIAIVGTVCNQPFRQSTDVALTGCVFDQRGLVTSVDSFCEHL
jgi:hypothetical protein